MITFETTITLLGPPAVQCFDDFVSACLHTLRPERSSFSSSFCLTPQMKSSLHGPCEDGLIDSAHPPRYLVPFLSTTLGINPGDTTSFSHLSCNLISFHGKHADHITTIFRLLALRRLALESCSNDPSERVEAMQNTQLILASWECPTAGSTVADLSVTADPPCEVVDIMLRSCTSTR